MIMVVLMIMSMSTAMVMMMMPVSMAVKVVLAWRPMAMVVARVLVMVVVLMAFVGKMIQTIARLFRRRLLRADQSDGDGFGRLVASTGGAHGDLVLRLRNNILG
jgi:hypothetical protein